MVRNRWNPTEAAGFHTELEQRVYSSRLLGMDPELVMHGGGNTSAKGILPDLFGEPQNVLFIKGSGWDLATIQAPGFPAVKLDPLLKLRHLDELDDLKMMNALRTQLLDAKAPDPSVEALLHAFLPHRFVDHTHADAVLTLTNQPDGEQRVREVFGDRVAIVPYVMPGFQLAKLCAEIFEKSPDVEGMVLMKHGIFSFGQTAKESYDRMISLVELAESAAGTLEPFPETAKDDAGAGEWMQAIRSEMLRRGFPSVLALDDSAPTVALSVRADAATLSQRGPLTPDHVIRTKRVPLFVAGSRETLARAMDQYAEEYRRYFARNSKLRAVERTMLDPWPRVFLVPGVGAICAGATRKDAAIARDIFSHTAAVILRAESLSGYEALPEPEIFDVEYWVLEQAKLKLGPKKLPLSGKVAAITGAASGIGRAIATELAEQGAVVHLLDRDASALESARALVANACRAGNTAHASMADVTSRSETAAAMARIVRESGGLDILVVNAGIFPESSPVEQLPPSEWEKSMRVNLDGAFHTCAEALKHMKRQGAGGDIVFVASKNVPAPGKGAAAYSVAKAGQAQLARVCALEAAGDGIRVNMLHPHLIFDTGFWTEAKIAERAKAYGMTPAEYRANNLLRTELTSRDVARAAFALVSGMFSKTTGAQIPVDGGSDRTL